MRYVLVVALLIVVSTPARSQTLPQHHATNRLARQTLAANPISLPFGTATGEYEHTALSSKTSVGVSLWYEYREVEARWAYAKALYYPGGTALRGLGLGPTLGVIRSYREDGELDVREYDTAAMIGAMTQYNWAFGRGGAFVLGIGMGARAALKDVADDSPLRRFDADVRLVLGVAL